MAEEMVVWVLEEEDLYGGHYLKGVFGSESSMLAWIQANIRGPVQSLRARQELVDRPDQSYPIRRFRNQGGVVVLANPF